MHLKEDNLTENHTTPMISEIYTKESINEENEQHFVERQKQCRESSSLRNLKIFPGNPQRNCTFMNSISVFPFHSQRSFVSNNLLNKEIVSRKVFFKFGQTKPGVLNDYMWQVPLLVQHSLQKRIKIQTQSDDDICFLLFL